MNIWESKCKLYKPEDSFEFCIQIRSGEANELKTVMSC